MREQPDYSTALPFPIKTSSYARFMMGETTSGAMGAPVFTHGDTVASPNFINQKHYANKNEEEFREYLLAIGFVTEPLEMCDEEDDPDPILLKGEPLSEMIIRERR